MYIISVIAQPASFVNIKFRSECWEFKPVLSFAHICLYDLTGVKSTCRRVDLYYSYQSDLQLDLRKPINISKELRFLAIWLVVLYCTVGHERPKLFFFY
jgi:hypothetical protein